MAQPVIVPPFGECWPELDDHMLLAAIAQSTNTTATSGGGSAPTGTYTSNPNLVTASGSIPAGVKSWGFTVVSGTVTLNGSGTLPVGSSFSGGGYPGFTMASALAYTITSGSALVTYDT